MNAKQNFMIESFSRGDNDAVTRIMAAIEQDEFLLYCQRIVPLSGADPNVEYHEALIRLIEEEEGLMPPGAFFPLVEKYDLMPHLDRWVVRHIVEWAASRSQQHGQSTQTTLFINLALPTLSDQDFPAYVHDQISAHGVRPDLLCFEITDAGLVQRHDDAVVFVEKIRQHGCGVAISSFGRERLSFVSLRGIKVDYLKIDGNIIFNVLRGATDLAKVVSIARVARSIGVRTVAEFVESEECIDKLRGVGIDFMQGFGVSIPRPLSDLA